MTGRRAARSTFTCVNVPSFTTGPPSRRKPRMVPPQDGPTFQAVSSATPNSSIFGLAAGDDVQRLGDHRAFRHSRRKP